MLIEEKEMDQRNVWVFRSGEGDARDFNWFQTPNNKWDVKWWYAQIEWDVISYRLFDSLFSFLGEIRKLSVGA